MKFSQEGGRGTFLSQDVLRSQHGRDRKQCRRCLTDREKKRRGREAYI